jgi:hypothetical protein
MPRLTRSKSLYMKKISFYLITGALLAFTNNVSAHVKTFAGLKAGVVFANQYGDDAHSIMGEEKIQRVGMDFGGMLKMDFTKLFSLVFEINYAQKGDIIQSTNNPSDYYTSWKYDYIDIPIMANFTLIRGPVSPYMYIGPQWSFIASARRGGKIGGDKMDDATLQDVSAMDFGLVAGGGLSIRAGSGKLLLEYRYGIGFISVDNSSMKLDKKNIVPATFSIGYLFGI